MDREFPLSDTEDDSSELESSDNELPPFDRHYLVNLKLYHCFFRPNAQQIDSPNVGRILVQSLNLCIECIFNGLLIEAAERFEHFIEPAIRQPNEVNHARVNRRNRLGFAL